MTAGIYLLIDPRDSTPFYVGKGIDVQRRAKEHSKGRRGCSSRKQIAEIHSAGSQYIVEILEYVDEPKAQAIPFRSHWDLRRNVTRLNDAEIWWVAYFRALGWNLTNRTDGGDGSAGRAGWKHTDETRRRISDVMRAADLTGDRNPAKRVEVREKISAAKRGRPRPDVTLSKKGVARPDMAGERNPVPLGSKRSEEVRRKIAEATRLRMSDPVVLAKMRKPRRSKLELDRWRRRGAR